MLQLEPTVMVCMTTGRHTQVKYKEQPPIIRVGLGPVIL